MPTETDLRAALRFYAEHGPELEPWPVSDHASTTHRGALTAGVAGAAILTAAGLLIANHASETAPHEQPGATQPQPTDDSSAAVASAIATARTAWTNPNLHLRADLGHYGTPTAITGQVIVSNTNRTIVAVTSNIGDQTNNATEVFYADVQYTAAGWQTVALRYPSNALNITPQQLAPAPGISPNAANEGPTTPAAPNSADAISPALISLLQPDGCVTSVDVDTFATTAAIVTVTSTKCPRPDTQRKAEAILSRGNSDSGWTVLTSWDLLNPNDDLVQ